MASWRSWLGAGDTEQAKQRAMRDMASHEFAAHQLHLVQPGDVQHWSLRRPNTGINGSHLIFGPGVVVVYGDLGEWVLRINTRSADESMGWVRGSHRSIRYVAEKVRGIDRCSGLECFYTGDLYADLVERHRISPSEVYKRMLRELSDRGGIEHRQEWLHIVETEGGDSDDYELGMGYSSGFFLLLEILAKFSALVPAQTEA